MLDPTFLVATDVVHHGYVDVAVDQRDVYGFEAESGDRIRVVARGTLGCIALLDPTGAHRGQAVCSYSEATQLGGAYVRLNQTGVWYLSVVSVTPATYRFAIERDGTAPDVSLPASVVGSAHISGGSDPTCGTGSPVTNVNGGGDATLPSLVYASLKTGFRAVVAWESETAYAARLSASLDGGAPTVLTEVAPTRRHVFILDGLPEGRTLCFTPRDASGAALTATGKALRLANAMNAYENGAYTLNLLVLANEQPDRADLEASLARYAETLHDASDGHVRSGRIITLYGDFLHHNSGWVTCYVTSVVTGDRPLCRNVHDVLFTYDGSIGGAAQTYADAIRDPARAIWMNQYLQAPLVGLADDAGRVLMHEMGHYAFGAQDLYGALTGTDPDCWNPAKSLSVMGGNRGATEFDDETNRCPNEAGLPGYIPTWTLLRQDFPNVPARTVINAGPAGDGGRFASHSFVFAPQLSDGANSNVQNDAGSGRDAGSTRETAVRISPGVLYTATGVGPAPDLTDAYVFHASAGQAFQGWVDGGVGCYRLLGPSGAELDSACSYLGAPVNTGPLSATLTATGDHVLEVSNLSPAVYRLGFALNAPAPDARLLAL